MRDKSEAGSGEVVLDWREPQALLCEKHLKAPLIVLGRNLGHTDTRTFERRYRHLSASYVADEIRRATPRFGAASEDDPTAVIGGVR